MKHNIHNLMMIVGLLQGWCVRVLVGKCLDA